jgi:hypothetical protein
MSSAGTSSLNPHNPTYGKWTGLAHLVATPGLQNADHPYLLRMLGMADTTPQRKDPGYLTSVEALPHRKCQKPLAGIPAAISLAGWRAQRPGWWGGTWASGLEVETAYANIERPQARPKPPCTQVTESEIRPHARWLAGKRVGQYWSQLALSPSTMHTCFSSLRHYLHF